MSEAYIVDACRTPRGVGKPGKGALAHMHPHHLGAAVLSALAERNDLDTAQVDDIIWGTSYQRGVQGNDLGRMSALDAGYDIKASGLTLDRFCGSGITSVNLAAGQVMSGFEDVVVAGGTEMMSFHITDADPAKPVVMDSGNMRLRASHPQSQQGVCADAIATLDGIDRETLDRLAYESQQKAAVALDEGRFDKALVSVKNVDGSLALDREEYPRPQTTLETLAELKPVFGAWSKIIIDENGATYGDMITKVYPELEGKMNHVHHAGNSSGVVDGSAAVLLASAAAVKRNGWNPRARIAAMANMGDCPTLMLNAPVPAARKVLDKAGLTLEDIDLFEINEAFAVVAEKFQRDLDLDRSKVNVNGGAIALGHPIGATGSILIGALVDELERTGGRYGLATMCAAGGMAPAVIVKRV